MNTHYGLSGDSMLTKQDEIIIKMKSEIDNEYSDGRTTIMGDDELEEIAERLSLGIFKRKRGSSDGN